MLLVTGFLGSGKTTLLQHLLATGCVRVVSHDTTPLGLISQIHAMSLHVEANRGMRKEEMVVAGGRSSSIGQTHRCDVTQHAHNREQAAAAGAAYSQTALLTHTPCSGTALRLGVLVNEAASIDVDGPLLDAAAVNAAAGASGAGPLAGGCACCAVAGDLAAALRRLQADAAFTAIDYLVSAAAAGD